MTREEMIEYLLDELKEERKKMLLCKENKYGYIFMLCNDMGIIPEDLIFSRTRSGAVMQP